MTTKIYSLTEIERIANENYELPESVLDSIRILCNLVGYTENTQNTYINQYNMGVSATTSTSNYKQKPKEREVRERTYKKPKESKEEWKRPAFKSTVFAAVDNTQALINDIRTGLNKINETNCEEKITMFLEKIDEIRELVEFGDEIEMNEKMRQVFNTIYAVCISNKMFSKIYANALVRISAKYEYEISRLINEKMTEYLESTQNIIDVDSNVDYDAFCEFTTRNSNRKNITSLFCEIAKTNKYEDIKIENIKNITLDLLNRVIESISTVEKQKEVEEITENIVIIFSHFKEELQIEFKPKFEMLASFKTSEKPGLTSRTKFKYMDLIGK